MDCPLFHVTTKATRMSRTARIVLPGFPHHMTHRGHHREDVFLSDRHFQRYLVWLAEAARKYDLRIWAYCLMSNHVHLIAVPENETALSNVGRVVHTRHAQACNEERGGDGHLWQGRYYSCPLDDAHLWEAVRYVERNPVRAHLVERAESYAWSSAPAHCGLRPDPVLASGLPLLARVDDWASWLVSEEDECMLNRLREHTRTGSPYGDDWLRRSAAEDAGRAPDERRS
ncbi:MAG: transposase [Armatimonadetes bacterium]|nr:transposase [Armatimonadota bacterium]